MTESCAQHWPWLHDLHLHGISPDWESDYPAVDEPARKGLQGSAHTTSPLSVNDNADGNGVENLEDHIEQAGDDIGDVEDDNEHEIIDDSGSILGSDTDDEDTID